jgi:diguanylate cyclase (GGDEF)-like protein
LPNRHGLLDRLELMREKGPITVLFIDLDGFKEVNDELGHEAGDGVLVEAATRIACSIPADTVLGRLGGDEFLAACPGVDLEGASAIAHSILDALDGPWPVLRGLHIGASIGVAVNATGETLDCAIRRADAAMYEAKCFDGASRRIVLAPTPTPSASDAPALDHA